MAIASLNLKVTQELIDVGVPKNSRKCFIRSAQSQTADGT